MNEPSGTPTEPMYLRGEAKVEPLVCGWYAWPHLVAPASLAMNIAFRHVPLLQSFLANPTVHIAASKDPKMFGGPFVDLSVAEVPAVKALLEEIQERCASLLVLARDLKGLDKLLQETARGHSLNEHYAKLPQSLQGLLELVYDLNNHPRIRLLEELLYEERLTRGGQQIALAWIPERERSFFMSTPRLRSADRVNLDIPFGDPRVDLLGMMRTQALSPEHVERELAIAPSDRPLFRRCLTGTEPRRRADSVRAGAVRIRYFGHACVLVESAQTSVLFDPLLAWEQKPDARFTFHDLPDRIDYVVLTHNHQDHCSPECLLQLRHKVNCVIVPRNCAGSLADPSMKLIMRELGFNNVQVLEPMESLALADGELTSLFFPGEHVDLDIHTKQAAFLEICGRRLLFLIDSDAWDPALYRRVLRKIGPQLHAVFVGMECHGAPLTWLYGPLLTRPISRRDDESRRLSGSNCERAWRAVEQMSVKRAYVYALGQEPWLRYIMGLEYEADSIQLTESRKFVERCRDNGIEAEILNGSFELAL